MGRMLPWLKSEASKHAQPRAPTTPATPKEQPAYRIFRSQRDGPELKTPPSSPPAQSAPEVEEMIEGDEAWIMVEDELKTIAQEYTKRLHNDELRRLQREAKDRVSTMHRPTTGSLHSERHKSKTDAKRAKMQRAIDARNGSDPPSDIDELEDEQDLLIADRNLAGLMFGEAPLRDISQRSVASLDMAKPKTRAAAGLSRQREDRDTPMQSSASQVSGISCQISPKKRGVEVRLNGGGDDDDDDDFDTVGGGRPTSVSSNASALTFKEPNETRRSPALPHEMLAESHKPITETSQIKHDENDDLRIPKTSDAVMNWRRRKAAKTQAHASIRQQPRITEEEEPAPASSYSMDTIPMF